MNTCPHVVVVLLRLKNSWLVCNLTPFSLTVGTPVRAQCRIVLIITIFTLPLAPSRAVANDRFSFLAYEEFLVEGAPLAAPTVNINII